MKWTLTNQVLEKNSEGWIDQGLKSSSVRRWCQRRVCVCLVFRILTKVDPTTLYYTKFRRLTSLVPVLYLSYKTDTSYGITYVLGSLSPFHFLSFKKCHKLLKITYVFDILSPLTAMNTFQKRNRWNEVYFLPLKICSRVK